jgi:hypothetical protein
MTVIVGLVADDGTVYLLGADSAGVAGWSLTQRRDAKVFRVGEFVFGFTDSFRMGQLLRHGFKPPEIPEGADLFEYMVATFVPELRKCLKEGGYATVNNNQEKGGTFLVGVRGRLFKVEGDFQVGESLKPYDACGCGQELALGALFAQTLDATTPQTKVFTALAAAETFSAGVRGPFVLEQTREEGGAA